MKSLNLTQIQAQSKLILATAVITASAAISLAFYQPGNATSSMIELGQNYVQQVIVEGARMTDAEKLNYDLAPQEIARVEIIGKRLTAEEKRTMIAEDESMRKNSNSHHNA